MITRTFKLCLNAGTGSAPYINVSQYDEGETWLFELYSETGERYIPTTGAIVGVKSDGHGIANTGTVDSEGRVVIAETQQMTASAGRAIYELSIDGLTHGTANFIVAVERKPTDDAVMSDSDLSLIQQAVDSAEVIVEVIGDSDPSEVIGEHVDAWLDNHPEATTTVEDEAITAPKINNSLWDKLLVSESASGNPASFEDGADDVPVSSLKVALEPIQTGSGDPSPSNIRPIYPANGKNLFDNSPSNIVEGASIATVSGADITNSSTSAWASIRYEMTLPAGAYTVSVGKITQSQNNVQVQVAKYSGGTYTSKATLATQNSSANFTTTETETIRISLYSSVANNPFTASKVMIRLASITDGTYQPYQGIMVERVGKNVLPITVQGIISANNWGWSNNTATRNNCVWTILTDDGTNVTGIEVNGTANANTYLYILPTTQNMRYLPTGSYIINGGVANTAVIRAWHYDGSNTVYSTGDDASFTLTETGRTGGVVDITVNNGTVLNHAVFKPMIRYASVTDSNYEPYIGNSYPYTLGQPVYGGTVDLATGVLTVDRAYLVFDGSSDEAWSLKSASRNYMNIVVPYMMAYYNSNAEPPIISNIALPIAQNVTYGQYEDSRVSAGSSAIGSNTLRYLFAGVTDAMTVDEFKTWLSSNPLEVCYELVTPTTVQLTPTEVKTLLGYNNISSTGTVDVIYHADTKLYVDKMTAVDNNIIAPTEATFTATRNYTTNDLVIVNDTLYKVTANIANGGTITPNSNVQQTTLSALIKALS